MIKKNFEWEEEHSNETYEDPRTNEFRGRKTRKSKAVQTKQSERSTYDLHRDNLLIENRDKKRNRELELTEKGGA